MGFNEIPWTFKTWIAKFIEVDLPIGDLARDISNDKNFPDSEDFRVIYRYLQSQGADYLVLDAFKVSWKFYQISK